MGDHCVGGGGSAGCCGEGGFCALGSVSTRFLLFTWASGCSVASIWLSEGLPRTWNMSKCAVGGGGVYRRVGFYLLMLAEELPALVISGTIRLIVAHNDSMYL